MASGLKEVALYVILDSPPVFGGVRVAHLFSFLCCVFGGVRVAHLFSFLCCVFGGVRVAHLFSFLCCVFCFVCFRILPCVPNVVSFSELSVSDCLFVFFFFIVYSLILQLTKQHMYFTLCLSYETTILYTNNVLHGRFNSISLDMLYFCMD